MVHAPLSRKKAILLTGALGLLGQSVLQELLQLGCEVGVIVRCRGRRSSTERSDRLIGQLLARSSPLTGAVRIIDWDLRNGPIALRRADRTWIERKVNSILHCAASVRFVEDESAREPQTSNVEGTRNLLTLAQSIGDIEFHHVSTAYVCGNRTGTIFEADLDCGQQFHNIYERSKFDAELLVQTMGHPIRKTCIYRPSIVLGDSKTGFASAFHTLYVGLRFARALSQEILQDVPTLIHLLNLSGEESKNIVPVDWVASSLVAMMSRTDGSSTLHLTSPAPISMKDVCSAMIEAIGSEPEAWEQLGRKRSTYELDFESARDSFLGPFQGYFRPDPIFDRSNLDHFAGDLPHPRMDRSILVKLFRYAIRNQFREEETQLGIEQNGTPIPEGWVLHRTGIEESRNYFSFQGIKIDFSGPFRDGTGPRVQTSHSTWNELIAHRISLADAMRGGKLLLWGSPAEQKKILPILEQILQDSNETNQSLVVPSNRYRCAESRHHA